MQTTCFLAGWLLSMLYVLAHLTVFISGLWP